MVRARTTAGLCAAALALLGQQVVTDGPLTRVDHDVESWLVPRRDGVVGHLARLLLHLGEPALVVPLLLLVAVLVGGRAALARAVLLVAALGVGVLVLKGLVARPTAHHPSSPGRSWPSGHAATAAVAWWSISSWLRARSGAGAPPPALSATRSAPTGTLPERSARLVPLPALVLCRVVPLLVAVCLVVGGRHQVTDVLAGLALGGLLVQASLLRWAPGPVAASTPG